MDTVDEPELVLLQLVTCQLFHDVVLVHQRQNPFVHAKVAFDVVRDVEGSFFPHLTELFDKFVVSVLQGHEVESEGGDFLPVFGVEDLEDVADVVLLVESLALFRRERLDDVANLRQVLNELLVQSLLSELRERTGLAEGAEVLEIDAGLHEVDDGRHRLQVDFGEDRVRCLCMLHVLLLEVFEFADEFFLPRWESVWLQVVIVVALVNMPDDVQKLLLAVEMILVAGVGDLVGLAVDLDEVGLKTLEDHCAEDCLFVSYNGKWVVRKWRALVTYTWPCDLGP